MGWGRGVTWAKSSGFTMFCYLAHVGIQDQRTAAWDRMGVHSVIPLSSTRLPF